MKIDVLKINVDKVTLREESKDGQWKQTDRGVGLRNKTFNNITSPAQLAALVFFEASGLGPLKNMAFSLTKGVMSEVKDVAGTVTGTAKKTVTSLVDKLKSAVDK